MGGHRTAWAAALEILSPALTSALLAVALTLLCPIPGLAQLNKGMK